MIEHQQRARPLVGEVNRLLIASGAASRSIPLLMPHLNLTYEALHPTAYSPAFRSFLASLWRFRRRVRYCVSGQVLLGVLRAKSGIEGLLRLQDTVNQMEELSHRRTHNQHLAFALC